MNIEIINPIDYPGWDNMLKEHVNASFFHTSAWARVLSESYDYKPIYFTAIENSKILSLIPLMEINSSLTGKRGVSLPFTDDCPLISKDPVNLEDILNNVIAHGKKAGWKHIDFRCDNTYLDGKPVSASFLMHFLDLSNGKDSLFSKLRDSTRRNIIRARKENVEVRIDKSRSAVETFFQLHCGTRKLHGLPPQPGYFFKKIFKRIIAQDNGFVVLAYRKNKAVAGAVFFHFKNQSIYKYGASDRAYLNLRPNNLIMWKAIEWFAENGFKSFSFGRTESENEGLLQFKRGWGTKERTLNYYKYNLKKDSFVSDNSGTKSSYRLFKIMPLPILKFTGNILYRHVG